MIDTVERGYQGSVDQDPVGNGCSQQIECARIRLPTDGSNKDRDDQHIANITENNQRR